MAFSTMQKRIGRAYDMLALLRMVGIRDITEGIYGANPPTAQSQTWDHYLAAQKAQHTYLLDEIGCMRNSHILDIGCGNGTLLEAVSGRHAFGKGVTLSRSQAAHCTKRSFNVHLCDYRELPTEWQRSFHGVVANGSAEHFAQPQDAFGGNTDKVYRQMFEIVHSLLIDKGRFVTTIIHFRQRDQVDPREIARGPYVHPRNSPEFHFSMILQRVLHGWYPCPGQLERCAAGLFRLIRTEDGTHDYCLTSEFWLRVAKKNLMVNPRIWLHLIGLGVWNFRDTWDAFRHYILDQSWMWQFRGDDPPTRLLRHTWQKV